MKHRCLNIIVIILVTLFSVSSLSAQDAVDTVGSFTGIEVSTAVDRADIYVGDLITYTLTITYDSSLILEPPPLGANLGAFDVKDFQPDQEIQLDDGRLENKTVFKLSTFTTGDYVIPPIPVIFTLPDGTRKALLSEGVPIKVQSLLFNLDDSADIKPLKAQYEFEPDRTAYIVAGALVLIVSVLILSLLWYRKRRQSRDEIEDTREPWEIAFEQLALLKQSGHLANKQYKEFYFLLTELYRAYLDKIYDSNFIDMTTEEFTEAFKEVDSPEDVYEQTLSLFKHADLVKFAKLIPEIERCDTDYEVIHRMIEQVRIDHLRRKEIESNLPETLDTAPESEKPASGTNEPTDGQTEESR